jgi:hypothetical protein
MTALMSQRPRHLVLASRAPITSNSLRNKTMSPFDRGRQIDAVQRTGF